MTNNFVEIMALKLALFLVVEKRAHRIWIFGDPQVIIKWTQVSFTCVNFTIHPIFDELNAIKETFISIYFHHIYRETNAYANVLFKEDLLLDPREWWFGKSGMDTLLFITMPNSSS